MKVHGAVAAPLIRPLLCLLPLLLLFSASGADAAEHFVTTVGNTFSPQELEIESGDAVTWSNGGGLHNVSADDGSFRCANGCDGEGGNGAPSFSSWEFSLIFTDEGDIPYFCEIHGLSGGIGMSGLITVVPEPSPAQLGWAALAALALLARGRV